MKPRIFVGIVFAAAIGMLLQLPCTALAGDIVIIANKDVTTSSMNGGDLKNVFLAKKTMWNNGEKIEFVTLKGGATHDKFLKVYLQKTSSQFNRYFRTLVFTGKGKAPRSFASEDELVGYVSGTGGAIGYVSSGTNTGSAKVITVN